MFAAIYAADAHPCSCLGMDGEPVSTIVEGPLAAVVSGVTGEKIRPERRRLATHQEVLKQLLAGTTPLPMSFGILANDSEAVRGILKQNQHRFLEQLEHVAGKVEMGLRVSWEVPNIFEYFVATHPELRAARDRLVGGGRAPTQEEKIELGRMFDRLRGEARNRCAEQVEGVVLRICSQIKVNNCRADNEVINLACLIRRQDQESFGDAVFQAARLFDNNFSFDYNGPWAPHNFVDIFLAA